MSKIKSALEIALERTDAVEADTSALKQKEMEKTGKRFAAKILQEESLDISELKKEIKEHRKDKDFMKGLGDTLVANLVLPKSDLYKDVLKKLETGFVLITNEAKGMENMFGQIDQFFQQYLDNRDQLKTQLSQQYMPRLQEKARAQGLSTVPEPEQDPEFLKILHDNYGQLDAQFTNALTGVYEELRTLYS
jgi:hypothetical protein